MGAYLFSKLMDYSKARNRRIFRLVEILFPDLTVLFGVYLTQMITSAISKEKKYLFIIRMSCIFFLINKTHCVFATVATCHLNLTSKYVILIIDRHLLSVCTITLGQPLRQLFYIFTLLSQTLQQSATSEQREQTTVQPPGHQWTGTNHQSEWL